MGQYPVNKNQSAQQPQLLQAMHYVESNFQDHITASLSAAVVPLSSKLDIKTGPAATTARRQGVIDNLELAPNQLHRVVDLASLQQLQARTIHDNLRIILAQEDSVFLLVYLGQIGQAHQILKAMAATAFHRNAQRKTWVRIGRHYLLESLHDTSVHDDRRLDGKCIPELLVK